MVLLTDRKLLQWPLPVVKSRKKQSWGCSRPKNYWSPSKNSVLFLSFLLFSVPEFQLSSNLPCLFSKKKMWKWNVKKGCYRFLKIWVQRYVFHTLLMKKIEMKTHVISWLFNIMNVKRIVVFDKKNVEWPRTHKNTPRCARDIAHY